METEGDCPARTLPLHRKTAHRKDVFNFFLFSFFSITEIDPEFEDCLLKGEIRSAFLKAKTVSLNRPSWLKVSERDTGSYLAALSSIDWARS
jgi:hypothetical protein